MVAQLHTLNHCATEGLLRKELDLAPKHVIVIGGGIIGAAFAYHLALAKARVTLLDEGSQRGGLATPMSWAWINGSWGNPHSYFRLRHHSMSLWRGLDKDVPGLRVSWTGGLLWDLPEAELRAFIAEQASWGYDIRLVEQSEVARLEPNLVKPPRIAAHAPGEGAVEPVHAVEQLLSAAESLGADVLNGVRVIRLADNEDAITGVITDEGKLEADEVVLAAGAATPQILATIGIGFNLNTPPGLLVVSEPARELLNGLVMAPEFHVRQRTDGALIAGSDFGGAEPGDDPKQAAKGLHALVVSAIKGAEKLALARFTIGYRPTIPDGVSAIGRVRGKRGLYVCVTHSGITLAPALASLGTAEIMLDLRDELLAPFPASRMVLQS
jgi:glycine/D-amino acid oxidase-like deaminating enzyme